MNFTEKKLTKLQQGYLEVNSKCQSIIETCVIKEFRLVRLLTITQSRIEKY